jgi:hypothetical protein
VREVTSEGAPRDSWAFVRRSTGLGATPRVSLFSSSWREARRFRYTALFSLGAPGKRPLCHSFLIESENGASAQAGVLDHARGPNAILIQTPRVGLKAEIFGSPPHERLSGRDVL